MTQAEFDIFQHRNRLHDAAFDLERALQVMLMHFKDWDTAQWREESHDEIYVKARKAALRLAMNALNKAMGGFLPELE